MAESGHVTGNVLLTVTTRSDKRIALGAAGKEYAGCDEIPPTPAACYYSGGGGAGAVA